MDIVKLQLIAESIRELLGAMPVSGEGVALRRTLAAGGVPDYRQDARCFAATFWERNFWKAAYFFGYEYLNPSMLGNRLLQPGASIEIVVLGAGSAADTVACLAWLEQEVPLQRVNLTLLDRSIEQLELARKIVGKAESLLDAAEFNVSYELMAADEWNPARDSADLVLMGHFLTESPQDLEPLVAKIVSALRPRGDVVIIERERDPIWQRARQLLALNGVTIHDVGLSNEKFKLLMPSLPPTERDMTPFYVRGSIPSNKSLLRIVQGYFQAWINRDSGTLSGIFTEQAIYDEKPGVEPAIQGLDAIRRYWDIHPGRQRNLALAVHNIAYGDTVGVCSFRGEFDTPKQHIAIQGSANFYLDPYLGKIHRFDEYFGTIKTPLRV